MTGSSRVLAVCVVHALLSDPESAVGVTSIDKRPVAGPVLVTELGVTGDSQSDTANHGGADQAVYAYAEADAAWWAGELARPVPPGLFGENLRTEGIDVTGAEIGERWRIGAEVVVEVTGPRIPCATFQRRMGESHWVRRFTERGAPGAMLRVHAVGEIEVGDPVEVVHRPGHGVTVGAAFLRPAPADMRLLLDAEKAGQIVLGESMRKRARKAVRRFGFPGRT
ncbi:MAG: MOSC domain-containing protein [Kineosporiaceae bacterium]